MKEKFNIIRARHVELPPNSHADDNMLGEYLILDIKCHAN